MSKDRKKILILIIGLIILDQAIKIIMLTSKVHFELGAMQIDAVQTERAQNNIQYILISIIAGTALIRYVLSNNSFIKLSNKVILSFAIAGVISNLIDRIIKGYVVNYIFLSGFTDFNLSYIYFLVTWIGMAVLLTINTRKIIKSKNVTKL